jgi:hypothetical protein
MATYYDHVETSEGIVHVLTKTRYLWILPIPRTSVMPHSGSQLGRLGTMIKWITNDPATLHRLHSRVIELVREFGVSGIRDIANSARMSDRVAFPMPDDVLRYIKSFV